MIWYIYIYQDKKPCLKCSSYGLQHLSLLTMLSGADGNSNLARDGWLPTVVYNYLRKRSVIKMVHCLKKDNKEEEKYDIL